MIDSSPPSSSTESSFRELDEVFLQTQTRIWLGELLGTRLDEDLPLPDLLQDGEILFQVSKVVWDFLMTKCMELRHLKHKYGPFGSKKSSGRYRPYSNVDSFLKTCKILGLNGIDLFSPSDVVEKRNIRKVCICIRALSKKARSKQLSVPDFDMVIYSVTMPTNMVGVIRRNLESSQSTFSSSSSYGSRKGMKTKLKKSNLYAPNVRDADSSSSDESDEAESRYMGENSISSPSNSDNADGANSDVEDVVESDVKFDRAATCCSISKKKVYHGISDINSEERNIYGNGKADVPNANFTLENDDPFTGDSSCIDAGENNYIANYLAFSDMMVHATDSSDSVVHDGENNMFDFFLNIDPHGATGGEESFHNGSQVYSDDEDMEVSSTTSMSSVLGRLLNLELDNQFNEDDSSSTNLGSSATKELESNKFYGDTPVLSEPPKMGTFHTELIDSRRFSSSVEACSEDASCGTQISNHGDYVCLENRVVVVANDNAEIPPLSREDDAKEIDEQTEDIALPQLVSDDTLQTNLLELVSDGVPPEGTITAQQEKREIISDITKDETKKHKGRPLLKKVVKGTAIAGVILLLLHIRKSNANCAQERSSNPQSSKFNGSRPSAVKQQSRSVGKGIYPTEKLKL